MPAYIFQDNLQSYSPGPGAPTNFNGLGIVFESEFFDFTTGPHPTPAPGFYERTGIGYGLFGQIAFPLNADLAAFPTAVTTVVWATLSQNFNPGLLSLSSTDPSNPTNQTVLLGMNLEGDASVSITAPGATKVNSLAPIPWQETWLLFQLVAGFGSTLVGGTAVVTVSVDLAVGGQILLSGALLVTNIAVSSLWNSASSVNQWIFTGVSNGQFFGEFSGTTDAQTLPFYPFPASTVNSHLSQAIVELGEITPSNARVTQGIVELMGESPSNARLTQAIVELIHSLGGGAGVFPEYVKRHHAPGNN
jgi:hypothetical protein